MEGRTDTPRGTAHTAGDGRTVEETSQGKRLHTTTSVGIGIGSTVPRTMDTSSPAGARKSNTSDGPMFCVPNRKAKDGEQDFQRAKNGYLDNVLRPLLNRIKSKHPETIGAGVNVEEEYSSWRTLKQGATGQARNKEIPPDDIEANNLWRQEERARGSTLHMALLERYADSRAVVPLLTRFSKML
jgi:hypothetical protein